MDKRFVLSALGVCAACAAQAAALFSDLREPDVALIDGKPAGDALTVDGEGRVLVRGNRSLSQIVLEWKAGFGPGARALGGEFERTYGDSAWFPVGGEGAAQRPRGGAMPWYFLVTDAGRTDGYGVAVQPNAFVAWHVAPDRIRLVIDCRAGSRPVRLGDRTLEACRLVSRKGRPGERAFEAGQAFCRIMCPHPRLPSGPVYGYNDWYCAYGRNTATNFLADAAFILGLVEGETARPYVVVDDGWQRGRQGSPAVRAEHRWGGVNPRWGMEMDEFARRVKAMGGRPGLWYRPFLPDDGLPNEGVPMDPTASGLKRRIVDDLRRFVDWGMELVKIDFITYEWCGVWGFEYGDSPVVRDLPDWGDETRTTAEVVKDLYAAMRAAVGDRAVIIGCNAIDHFAAGLFELQRTGDDTSGREWDRTRKMGPNTLGMRAIHNGTFYRVDGDCFGLSEAGLVPWELNAQWLDLVARSGTALFVSWRRQLTTPETRTAMERALRRAARAQPTGEPLDWMETPRPVRWRFGDETVSYDWK